MSDTKLNAIALYANFIVMALLGLLINPLLVHNLGAADFGVWKSCLRLMDLSGVADGRATQALKWIVAHGAKSNQANDLKRAVGASIIIWLLWLPILAVAAGSVIYLLPWLINGVTGDHLSIARWATVILSANVILSALVGIPDAVLFGMNQAYRSMVLTTVYLSASNTAILVAAWAGYGLPTLAAITLVATILNGFNTWLVVRRRVSWWGIAKPARADVARFAGFSNWTLVGSLVHLLLLSSEILLISFLSGPLAVTKYTFSSYSIQFAVAICLMTGSAVTPRLGTLIGGRDLQAAGKLVTQTREILLMIMTVAGAGILLLNRTFVSTWIGPEYYMGDTLNALMVIAFLQLALIRFDAQIEDVGLNIAKKVLIALAATCAGLLLGALCYFVFGSLEGLYIGLIVGRLPASIFLPQLVRKLVSRSGYSSRGVIGMIITMIALISIAPIIHARGSTTVALTSGLTLVLVGSIAVLGIVSSETRSLIWNGSLFRIQRKLVL